MKLRHIFQPRYKRLVNGIYPRNPYEGLKINRLKRMLIYAYAQPQHFNQVLMYLAIKLKKFALIDEDAYIKLTLEALNSVVFGVMAKIVL
ncbi:protein EFR3 homolog A-like [Zeugodacus cucurbitae]|uniref:protein EFR3 homolog A-like n=1 Tax=Zeugodacus cucurbitae TaxID=28588 RepID=UPI0023D95D47|nr:protein EFR3 homolog A-like [Zeugodacus cucurbitae]